MKNRKSYLVGLFVFIACQQTNFSRSNPCPHTHENRDPVYGTWCECDPASCEPAPCPWPLNNKKQCFPPEPKKRMKND